VIKKVVAWAEPCTAFVVEVPLRTDAAPSFKETESRQIAKCTKEFMRRELVWIKEKRFLGWGCSECAWVFNPSGAPTGQSLDEMKQNYEQRRDRDFATHVCAEHARASGTKDE
jgi:hypothetical protein